MTIQKKTDSEIQKDVLSELQWDTRVKATDVGVEVDEGIVTLTGTVDTWAARLAAEEAAHSVDGVHDVANDIHVKPPGTAYRDDTDIARAVRNALEWDVLVPDDRIKTTVSNGVVTLSGSVDFWSQRDDAERAVKNLAGVRVVENDIDVVAPKVPENTVRSAIEGALARHAAHAAKHVSITVAGGEVTLSGKVSSWGERHAIEGAARGTRGVRRVANRIAVGR